MWMSHVICGWWMEGCIVVIYPVQRTSLTFPTGNPNLNPVTNSADIQIFLCYWQLYTENSAGILHSTGNSSEFPEISNRSWNILNSNWQFWVWPNWRWTECYMDTYSNYNNALSHKELMNYFLNNKCLINSKSTVYSIRKMWAFAFKNSREHYKWKLRNTELKKQKFLVTCFDSNLKLVVKNITIPCLVYTD